LELSQEPSSGQTIIEKLERNASTCDSAVIVMTGDDIDADGQARARENVMHEIGFFQAKYGRSRVCLLHEEAVSIATNLSGVVYVPFPKGNISASFGVLSRELKAMYRI
jgi:predicted nucleotide-binding protein